MLTCFLNLFCYMKKTYCFKKMLQNIIIEMQFFVMFFFPFWTQLRAILSKPVNY